MLDNNKKPQSIIRCVHCGAEYLPAEIYLPEVFLGRPDDLVKDALGKIIYVDYQKDKEPDMFEEYICDYCNKPFAVEAVITYKTREEAPETDFSTTYVSLID